MAAYRKFHGDTDRQLLAYSVEKLQIAVIPNSRVGAL